MDPESKLLLSLDVGERTLTMAQRVARQVVPVLAPDCTSLFLTDGFREYMPALVSHYGQWVQPKRQQAKGPAPKPRWRPPPTNGTGSVEKWRPCTPAVATGLTDQVWTLREVLFFRVPL